MSDQRLGVLVLGKGIFDTSDCLRVSLLYATNPCSSPPNIYLSDRIVTLGNIRFHYILHGRLV